MKSAYFDCFSGAAGDMIVAALLHAGADEECLRRAFESLGVDGYSLSIEHVRKQGFAATRFVVDLDDAKSQPHRHLKDVCAIIERGAKSGGLSAKVCERAISVFRNLAEAEALVHGTTIEKVHFHEVGAVDAILDIVGACVAIESLGVARIVCSPIPTGSGTVRCEHGVMPVPAPATAELLKGIPLAACEETGELTTPTGAAILKTLASSFGPVASMKIESIGYGAGTREGKTRPNVLRVLIGDSSDDPSSDPDATDTIVQLEANLDDCSPEVIGYTVERLLDAGALDAFALPIQMKKGRLASLLTVLCKIADVDSLEGVLFAETTTFGIRRQTMRRSKLVRTFEPVRTRFGEIRMKVGRRGGVVTASPEYEDCRALAEELGEPLREIMDAARIAWTAKSKAK